MTKYLPIAKTLNKITRIIESTARSVDEQSSEDIVVAAPDTQLE